MKCSAWRSWELVNDEMIPTKSCPNEATVLLTSEGRWKDEPYCRECAWWMAMASAEAHFPLSEREIKEKK